MIAVSSQIGAKVVHFVIKMLINSGYEAIPEDRYFTNIVFSKCFERSIFKMETQEVISERLEVHVVI